MDWGFITRLGVCTGLFALGGSTLKIYADTMQLTALVISLLAYALGCFLFADVLRHGLGLGTVLATMLELSVMVIIGALFFDEQLGAAQYAGLLCAISAMVLFALPHSAI